jgi:small subunit ribosomal protein S1
VARTRFEAHRKQVEEAKAAEAEAGTAETAGAGASSYSSEAPEEDSGTLASDEALAALREKLTGGGDEPES